jgi:hypothetical protein
VTAGAGSDQGRLVEVVGAGVSAMMICLGDATVIGLRYMDRVQAALAAGAVRGSPADEVAAELLAAYAAYLRQLTQLPRLALLRVLHATSEASAAGPARDR